MSSTRPSTRTSALARAAGALALALTLPLTLACTPEDSRQAAALDRARRTETEGAAAGAAAAAAASDTGSRGALARYDLDGPPTRTVRLASALDEISGLALTPDGHLLAHGDEDATIYRLDPTTGAVRDSFVLACSRSTPGKDKKKKRKKHEEEPASGASRPQPCRGDFEDIAAAEGRVYLVTSGGEFYVFAEGTGGAAVPFTRIDTGLGRTCEIEGMTYEPATRALLLLCKQAHTDAWRDRVVVIGWSLAAGRPEAKPRFAIPYERLAAATGAKAFHGSAIALAPGGGSYLLVAGPQRAWAEVSRTGEVLGGGALDRAAHRQPEGLAVLGDGTLLVSDEAAGKTATLAAYAPR